MCVLLPVPVAPPTGLPWNRCVPWGFAKLLDFAWKRYQLPIYMYVLISFKCIAAAMTRESSD